MPWGKVRGWSALPDWQSSAHALVPTVLPAAQWLDMVAQNQGLRWGDKGQGTADCPSVVGTLSSLAWKGHD